MHDSNFEKYKKFKEIINLFETLDLSIENIQDKSQDEFKSILKKAYHKLSLKWHPDKNKEPAAEEKFKAINNANSDLNTDLTFYFLKNNIKEILDFKKNPNAYLAPAVSVKPVNTPPKAPRHTAQAYSENYPKHSSRPRKKQKKTKSNRYKYQAPKNNAEYTWDYRDIPQEMPIPETIKPKTFLEKVLAYAKHTIHIFVSTIKSFSNSIWLFAFGIPLIKEVDQEDDYFQDENFKPHPKQDTHHDDKDQKKPENEEAYTDSEPEMDNEQDYRDEPYYPSYFRTEEVPLSESSSAFSEDHDVDPMDIDQETDDPMDVDIEITVEPMDIDEDDNEQMDMDETADPMDLDEEYEHSRGSFNMFQYYSYYRQFKCEPSYFPTQRCSAEVPSASKWPSFVPGVAA